MLSRARVSPFSLQTHGVVRLQRSRDGADVRHALTAIFFFFTPRAPHGRLNILCLPDIILIDHHWLGRMGPLCIAIPPAPLPGLGGSGRKPETTDAKFGSRLACLLKRGDPPIEQLIREQLQESDDPRHVIH